MENKYKVFGKIPGEFERSNILLWKAKERSNCL